MITQAVSSINIDAPPEVVWPWIGQIEKHAEWSPKQYEVELVSGEPDAMGSKYRSVGWVPGEKEHGMDVVLTDVVPGKRFALRATISKGPSRIPLTFEKLTRVRRSLTNLFSRP
jgi:uncharacterized protein YndB with AHSA1/START domain